MYTGAGPKKWGAFEMGCCGFFGWLVGLGWFGCCLSFFLGGGGERGDVLGIDVFLLVRFFTSY